MGRGDGQWRNGALAGCPTGNGGILSRIRRSKRGRGCKTGSRGVCRVWRSET